MMTMMKNLINSISAGFSTYKMIIYIGISILAISTVFFSGFYYKGLLVESAALERQNKEIEARNKLQDEYQKEGLKAAALEQDLIKANQKLLQRRKYETKKDPLCSDRSIPLDKLQLLREAASQDSSS